jgi:hypothetical protein
MDHNDIDYDKRRDFLLAFMTKQNAEEQRRVDSDDKKYFGRTFRARKYGENLKTYSPKRYKKH